MQVIRDLLKGVAVVALCMLGMGAQLSLCPNSFEGVTLCVMLALWIGCGLAAISVALRRDRGLVMLAGLLTIMMFVLVFGTVSHDSYQWHETVMGTYPWLVGGVFALARWTRKPAAVPTARARSFQVLPQLRPLTGKEISVALWLGIAVVAGLCSTISVEDYDLGESIEWRPLVSCGLFATMALPIGVALGTVAEQLPRHRLALLLLIAAATSLYAKVFASGLHTVDVPSWAILPVVASTIVLERLTRPPPDPYRL